MESWHGRCEGERSWLRRCDGEGSFIQKTNYPTRGNFVVVVRAKARQQLVAGCTGLVRTRTMVTANCTELVRTKTRPLQVASNTYWIGKDQDKAIAHSEMHSQP